MNLKLHPRLKLLLSDPPASPEEMDLLKQKYPHMPEDYWEFVSESDGFEMESDTGAYFRIYGPSWASSMGEGHSVSRYIPGAVPVGDDAGGDFFLYSDGPQGFGLYRMDMGVMDLAEATWMSPNLASLLRDGEGLDR